jgi:hypothetical protein
VGLRASLEGMVKRKISSSCQDSLLNLSNACRYSLSSCLLPKDIKIKTTHINSLFRKTCNSLSGIFTFMVSLCACGLLVNLFRMRISGLVDLL